jgi:hypothetical protein
MRDNKESDRPGCCSCTWLGVTTSTERTMLKCPMSRGKSRTFLSTTTLQTSAMQMSFYLLRSFLGVEVKLFWWSRFWLGGAELCEEINRWAGSGCPTGGCDNWARADGIGLVGAGTATLAGGPLAAEIYRKQICRSQSVSQELCRIKPLLLNFVELIAQFLIR